MAQTVDMDAIRKLSHAERIALMMQIWETLVDDDDVPISDAVLDEMERRAAELDVDPSKAISHDEMMRRLRSLQ